MQKIHIDTDIGGDIDDLCALAMVLRWPGVELTGVTTVAEHVGTGGQRRAKIARSPEHRVGTGGQRRAKIARSPEHRAGKRAGMVRFVLGLAGRTNVPVAAGAEASLPCYRVFQDLPEEAVYWPEPIDPGDTSPLLALDLLERSIHQGAIIAAIGPFTNLARIEQHSPGILQTARLVLMGGYVFPPRPGYPTWSHEMDWNVQVDVQSALYVLERSNPLLVPLAVTVETALRRAYLPRLRQSGPLGQLIARQAEAHALEYKNEETYGQTCANLPPDIINFQHDPLACAIALGWGIEQNSIQGVEVRELPLKSEIRDGWLRQVIDEGGKPTRVVTTVDGERFNEFWLSKVAG